MPLNRLAPAARAAVRCLDAATAALVVLACAATVALRLVQPRGDRPPSPRRSRLLVLDSAYALSTVRARRLEHSLLARDLGGFFEHVWHVHPLVGADEDEAGDAHGGPITTELAPGHTVIEGHAHNFRRPYGLPLLDFALAQARLLRHLLRLLDDSAISIVRVGDPYYQGLLGLALARVGRIPLVIRVNGNYDALYASVGRLAYPRLFRRRRVEKLVDRFVLPRADLVAGANEDNLRYALANGARPDRSTVFRYGNLIDPTHFTSPADREDVRHELELPDGCPFLVCVGRLETVKLPEDVLEVLALARRDVPTLLAVYVGDGSLRTPLQKRADSLGISDGVRFAGSRDQAWIARALAAASVVVAPNAGRALVEASLSATPIVTYDIEWHAELVRDGETGILIAARDTAAMAEAVVRLLRNETEAVALGARARAAALEMMDPDALMQHEREWYARLVRDMATGAGTVAAA